LITLLSDFGYKDPFVGVMKGVIARLHPAAAVVDLTHGIPPQDVLAGALVLRHSAAYFPRGTIHVAVVDPGVGGARRPLLIESAGDYFIGPDNGILSLAVEARETPRIIHLSNAAYHLQPRSATFHGRDVFAPVAAHLSRGVAPAAFGETVEQFVRLRVPESIQSERELLGEIVYIDGFGNLFTNILEQDLRAWDRDKLSITIGGVTIGRTETHYGAAASGACVALINSWGLLEIALNQESAERRLGAKIGDKVRVFAA
jgi:S-adenosyl-L-methionine hydrolase (adenosine-forming)